MAWFTLVSTQQFKLTGVQIMWLWGLKSQMTFGPSMKPRGTPQVQRVTELTWANPTKKTWSLVRLTAGSLFSSPFFWTHDWYACRDTSLFRETDKKPVWRASFWENNSTGVQNHRSTIYWRTSVTVRFHQAANSSKQASKISIWPLTKGSHPELRLMWIILSVLFALVP